MPQGIADDGTLLKVIRVFSRPSTINREKLLYYGKITAWVEDHRIVEIDRALQILKKTYPQKSLSRIVCDALIDYAGKVERREKRLSKAGKHESEGE